MPNSSFPRDFGEGSTTNRLDGTSFAYFKTLHLSLHASSQRWLLPKAPMQHAAVTTSACSFCCIAACKRVMATMLLTHPVITHQHSCGWLTHDEDIHLVIYPVSVYLYPNFYAIATICVHSHDLNLLLSFTCAGCNQHPVWVYPPKMVLPHKKVNTHCKSRSDRLRMCPKHMIKKRKDVNKLFLVNVTLTSTNAKNPMSLSTYIYTLQNFHGSIMVYVFEGVILVVFPHLSSTSIFPPKQRQAPPPTTCRLLPNVLHLHKHLRQHCTWWCWIESLGGPKAKGSLGSQCRWWFYYILKSKVI